MARARGPLKIQPLWLRVERNRLKLAVFIVAFLLAWALAFVVVLWAPSVLILKVVASVGTMNGDPGWLLTLSRWVLANLSATGVGIGIFGAACSAAYAAVSLSQPLRKQLVALGVHPANREFPESRSALRDMAIASGFAELQPELFILESSSLNAFIIARAHQRAYVVITSRMAKRMSQDRQRAVFANLMARLRGGDVQWATAVSALMAPVWRWKDLSRTSPDTAALLEVSRSFIAGDSIGPTYSAVRQRSTAGKDGIESAGYLAALPLVGPLMWLTYAAAVVASELVAFGHRRSHLLSSTVADAEGMLVLKDPVPMLEALREAIEVDNRVRIAQPLYAQLFYIWAGDGLTDEDDPEWQRLDRLQEIVGVDGVADAESDMLRPAEEYSNLFVPPSPVMEASGLSRRVLPPPEDFVRIPEWALTIAPIFGAFLASMLAASRLVTMGVGRPVWAGPGAPEWVSYARAFASAEVVAIISVAAVVFFAAAITGKRSTGALIGVLCGGLLLSIDIGGRGLTTAVDLGMRGQLMLALVAGTALVAGVAGGALGSLVRRG